MPKKKIEETEANDAQNAETAEASSVVDTVLDTAAGALVSVAETVGTVAADVVSAVSSPAAPAKPKQHKRAEKVGIVECDNFINAYETCVSSKVPEAARASLKTSITTWRTEWKKLADNPQTRSSLAAACQRQRETTMTAMKAYNCTW